MLCFGGQKRLFIHSTLHWRRRKDARLPHLAWGPTDWRMAANTHQHPQTGQRGLAQDFTHQTFGWVDGLPINPLSDWLTLQTLLKQTTVITFQTLKMHVFDHLNKVFFLLREEIPQSEEDHNLMFQFIQNMHDTKMRGQSQTRKPEPFHFYLINTNKPAWGQLGKSLSKQLDNNHFLSSQITAD